jgi:hypothetical protein
MSAFNRLRRLLMVRSPETDDAMIASGTVSLIPPRWSSLDLCLDFVDKHILRHEDGDQDFALTLSMVTLKTRPISMGCRVRPPTWKRIEVGQHLLFRPITT